MTEYLLENLTSRLEGDLLAIAAELILSGTIVLMLLLRLFPRLRNRPMGLIVLVFTTLAFAVTLGQWAHLPDFDPRVGQTTVPRHPGYLEIFGGMLVFDDFTIFFKLFLLVFLGGVVKLTMLTGIPDREDSADFYTLLLGSTIGMMLMASANHLLMVFLAVEMTSLPSYALAGFLKGRRQSSEAALKYVVYGGGAAGVMLYGISLLAGKFGTAYMPDLLRFVAASLVAGPDLLVLMGLLFIMVGIAFKLSAVPFHFWCPDVFEGAAAEIGAFLSVASKAGALALLARFVLPLASLSDILVPALGLVAAVTTTFGNLAAYAQTNLKRLLAYSTIAHAGFMMMGLATLTRVGAESVLFYLATYLLMNLGAFAVVAFLRNATGSEDLRSFRGIGMRSPILVTALGVFLLSLLGLPPLAGFAAKFQIFSALFDAARQAPQDAAVVRNTFYALIAVGGLNTVLSLFYYVKVLKVMILDKPIQEIEGEPLPELRIPCLNSAYAVALAVAVLVIGIFWNPLAVVSQRGVTHFQSIAQGGER